MAKARRLSILKQPNWEPATSKLARNWRHRSRASHVPPRRKLNALWPNFWQRWASDQAATGDTSIGVGRSPDTARDPDPAASRLVVVRRCQIGFNLLAQAFAVGGGESGV